MDSAVYISKYRILPNIVLIVFFFFTSFMTRGLDLDLRVAFGLLAVGVEACTSLRYFPHLDCKTLNTKRLLAIVC
jgi:hypothetical protein